MHPLKCKCSIQEYFDKMVSDLSNLLEILGTYSTVEIQDVKFLERKDLSSIMILLNLMN